MIQIIRGVYGYLDRDGIVRPKTEDDGPFTLMPEQEERLVRLGVAQYVNSVKLPPEPADFEEEEEPAGEEETLDVDIPLSEFSVKELREMGKNYGLTFKVGMSKAEMISAIEAAEAALDEDVYEDGEDAPVFDAAEAVQ